MRALAFLVFVLAAFGLRYSYLDAHHAQRTLLAKKAPRAAKSPGKPIIRLMSFEQPLAAADLIWLDMVQTFSQRDVELWRHVDRQADIATDFDPHYFTIYHSAAVLLGVWGHRVDASDQILRKGQAALPQRWELSMLLGYNAYFIRGQAAEAADHMRRAAAIPGAPRFLGALSGRMRSHGGSIEDGVAFLDALIPSLEGVAQSDAVERRLLLLSELILLEYDDACQSFRIATGLKTADPMALYLMRWTSRPPNDLMGFAIKFDDDCFARTQLTMVREFEARKRAGQDAP